MPSAEQAARSGIVRPQRLVALLAVGVVVQLAGRALDGWWHATHEQFETATNQLEAHWLVWLGVLITLAVAVAALRAHVVGRRGWWVVLTASVAYVVAATWHFVEHAAGRDPAAPHVAISVVWISLLASGALTAFAVRRAARASAAPSTNG